jgi:hypothetical protein
VTQLFDHAGGRMMSIELKRMRPSRDEWRYCEEAARVFC